MAEIAFLRSTANYLSGAGLSPAPALVGSAEPDAINELPALVLSLDTTVRAPNGLGERAAAMSGALPWQATIDLANPVLPEEPAFSLLDATRRVLTLPHGGLVTKDGAELPLTGVDLTVKLSGVPVPLVAGVPAVGQVSVDPAVGQLTFGSALPPTGSVAVTYFLGQWEQRTRRASGVLRIDVCDATANGVTTLANAVLDAMEQSAASAAITRLISLAPAALSSVGRAETSPALRRQTLRFAFAFEQELNQPDSSGGVIRRIDGRVRVDATQDHDLLVTG